MITDSETEDDVVDTAAEVAIEEVVWCTGLQEVPSEGNVGNSAVVGLGLVCLLLSTSAKCKKVSKTSVHSYLQLLIIA